MLSTIENLCGQSKIVFYSNISRIKRKFINTIGVRKAKNHIIIRHPDGHIASPNIASNPSLRALNAFGLA